MERKAEGMMQKIAAIEALWVGVGQAQPSQDTHAGELIDSCPLKMNGCCHMAVGGYKLATAHDSTW